MLRRKETFDTGLVEVEDWGDCVGGLVLSRSSLVLVMFFEKQEELTNRELGEAGRLRVVLISCIV